MKLPRFSIEAIVSLACIILVGGASAAAAIDAAKAPTTSAPAPAASAAEVKIITSALPTAEELLTSYAAKREQLDPLELKELLSLVGFKGKNLKEAWAVAMKESTGRPASHNDNAATADNSYGLFQINMRGYLGEARREKFELKQNSDLLNPVVNAQIAYHMSNGGADWGSWGIGANAYNGGKAGSYYDWLTQYPTKE